MSSLPIESNSYIAFSKESSNEFEDSSIYEAEEVIDFGSTRQHNETVTYKQSDYFDDDGVKIGELFTWVQQGHS